MRRVPLERDSKIYVHVVYGEDSQLQQLSGSEESWIKQKERLNRNTVVTETSGDPLGSSDAEMTFQRCPVWARGLRAFPPL